jgi:hypothetical protein
MSADDRASSLTIVIHEAWIGTASVNEQQRESRPSADGRVGNALPSSAKQGWWKNGRLVPGLPASPSSDKELRK